LCPSLAFAFIPATSEETLHNFVIQPYGANPGWPLIDTQRYGVHSIEFLAARHTLYDVEHSLSGYVAFIARTSPTKRGLMKRVMLFVLALLLSTFGTQQASATN